MSGFWQFFDSQMAIFRRVSFPYLLQVVNLHIIDVYFQTLQLEMKQQEELLEELEATVQEYRAQDKVEAANRLEQQTQLLRVRLDL